VQLNDVPPPTVPPDWITTPALVKGYSFSLPAGWSMDPMPKEKLKEFVDLMNESAWSMMGQQKADVDYDTALALYCARSGSVIDLANPLKLEEQFLIVVREELDETLSLKQAADRWRDTIRLEGEQNPPKEESHTLPVGPAIALTKSNTTMGFIDKVTAYVLVDGKNAYFFYFNETASNDAEPIPTKAIMDTFRIKRG
jgi:hypothetical protein